MPPSSSLVKLNTMQSEKTFFEDLARLMTGAVGAIGDAGKQIEERFREQIERLLAKMDLPTREEVEAIKTMSAAARDENERLAERVSELEAIISSSNIHKSTSKGRNAVSGDQRGPSTKKPIKD